MRSDDARAELQEIHKNECKNATLMGYGACVSRTPEPTPYWGCPRFPHVSTLFLAEREEMRMMG